MRIWSDEEVVLEIDNHVSEKELSSDDEEDEKFHQPTSLTSTLLRKDDKIEWKSESQTSSGRHKSGNVVKRTLG